MRRSVGWAVVAVLVAGGLVALVRGGGGSDPIVERFESDAMTADATAKAATESTGSGASAEVAADAAAPGEITALAAADAQVVRRATLTLEVRGRLLDRRFAAASDLAGFLGGYVESSDRQQGSASITMRVPAASYGDAMARLSELGRVTDRNERGEDVTAQVVDLDARIRNQQAEETALQALMGGAQSTSDALAVRAQLASVREQIEVLTAQRNLLRDQAAFATIGLGFRTVGAVASPPPSERSTLAAAWHDAVHVALSILAGTIVVLGALIPIGLLVGTGALIWAVVRRRRPGMRTA